MLSVSPRQIHSAEPLPSHVVNLQMHQTAKSNKKIFSESDCGHPGGYMADHENMPEEVQDGIDEINIEQSDVDLAKATAFHPETRKPLDP
jgi:hypothetical protein